MASPLSGSAGHTAVALWRPASSLPGPGAPVWSPNASTANARGARLLLEGLLQQLELLLDLAGSGPAVLAEQIALLDADNLLLEGREALDAHAAAAAALGRHAGVRKGLQDELRCLGALLVATVSVEAVRDLEGHGRVRHLWCASYESRASVESAHTMRYFSEHERLARVTRGLALGWHLAVVSSDRPQSLSTHRPL